MKTQAKVAALELLYKCWNSLNHLYFGGKLQRTPRFELKPYRLRYGRFIPGIERDTIRIAQAFFENAPGYSLEELIVTLGHEMTHQWQLESGLPLEHDKAFWKKVKKVGLW